MTGATENIGADAARPVRDLFSWIPLALAIGVVVAASAGGGFFAVARYGAMAVLALQVIVEVRQGRNQFMTSPLFLLSALTVTFYSFVQGIWGHGFVTDPPKNVYVGGAAEAVVLSFGMGGIVFYVLSSRYWRTQAREVCATPVRGNDMAVVVAIMFVLAVALLNGILFHLKASGYDVPALAVQVRFCTPALVSFSLFFLVRAARGGGRKFGIAVLATVFVAVLALVYVREGKIVIFIVCALALYAARLHELGFRRLLLAAVATLAVGLAMIQIVQMVRQPHLSILASVRLEREPVRPEPPNITERFYYMTVYKGVWRQTETGYCFGNVLKEHADAPFDFAKQDFWLLGLAPRVLWPDKPSLSLGRHYATWYCDIPEGPTSNTHSASITLLGQPVINGGWVGLVVHGGLLLLALAAMERLNRDPRALPGVLTGALLPYLIDFDQDFALYVANAVKFALVMGVLYIPVSWAERRRSRAP